MVGRTDRFRAAATVYPVINWYSWVLTSDIPSFGAKYWFPGMPWQETEHYMERSLFSVFDCVEVDGGSYFQYDTSFSCDTPLHRGFQALSLACILLYGVAFPLGLSALATQGAFPVAAAILAVLVSATSVSSTIVIVGVSLIVLVSLFAIRPDVRRL